MIFKILPEFNKDIYILAFNIIEKIDEGVIVFDEDIKKLEDFYEESNKNFSGFGLRKQRTNMLKSCTNLLKLYQKTIDDLRYKKLDHKLISNNPVFVKQAFKNLAECENLYYENR